jgi:transposase-like protein
VKNEENRRSFDMTRRKGNKDYPEWVKREAIHQYLIEGLPTREILERFSIPDRNRLNLWVKQYREEGEAMFEEKPKGRPPKKENTPANITRLEMELELLKKFHTELRQGSLAKRDIGSSKKPRKIRSESDVSLLWCLASCVLRLAEKICQARSGSAPYDTGQRSFCGQSTHLWIQTHWDLDPATQRYDHQP